MSQITIGEVIAMVDGLKPNVQTQEDKISWLDSVDRIFKEDIIDTHEGFEKIKFDGYTEDTPLETPLLIPAHYGRDIYRFYLEAQIDLVNQEYNKYNVSSSLFANAYNNYVLFYHNHNIPLQPNSIHF